MRPKTSTNRGAVELPLTYVYAVLIGIVIFIVATRVIAVQGQSADDRNTEQMLSFFDSMIEGFAQNPNTIQSYQAPRADVRLDWEDHTRIIVGRGSSPLRIPVFSERRLGPDLTAWTYPYNVETASSPLLFLSDGSITYRIANLTPQASGARMDISNEIPARAATYGLTIPQGSGFAGGADTRELCIGDLGTSWFGCQIRFVSKQTPYGYLSWGDDWHPIVSYGELFSALFAAGEDEWKSAISSARARDRVNREVLIGRAQLFKDSEVIAGTCDPHYQGAIGNLTVIKTTIAGLSTENPPVDLDAFDPIPSAITNLTQIDRTLTRHDCPAVIR